LFSQKWCWQLCELSAVTEAALRGTVDLMAIETVQAHLASHPHRASSSTSSADPELKHFESNGIDPLLCTGSENGGASFLAWCSAGEGETEREKLVEEGEDEIIEAEEQSDDSESILNVKQIHFNVLASLARALELCPWPHKVSMESLSGTQSGTISSSCSGVID
jgi:hypothetical protein